jgi:hypothetical protein
MLLYLPQASFSYLLTVVRSSLLFQSDVCTGYCVQTSVDSAGSTGISLAQRLARACNVSIDGDFTGAHSTELIVSAVEVWFASSLA